MFYQTRAGDSPAIIARRFGVSVGSLVNANAHKPTTTVAGKRTWRSLHQGEKLRVPIGVGDGFLGVVPASPGGSHPQVKRYAGSPPDQVALVQSRLGLSTDGIFGAGTESAVKAFQASNGLAADGIVGPGTWSKLLGGAVTTTAPATAASAPASNSLQVAATAAIAAAALAADPSYCTSVARSGTPVNSAVHNFKTAWNSANPGQAVPINTGNYEPVVASALSSALGGLPVAPGCGGGSAPAIAPISLPSISLPQAIPISLPTAGSVPVAVQAMSGVDPCYSENAPMVCAMQSALGLPADGKYGPGTAAALRRFLPNAPAGCVGPPLWWGKTTDNKCGGAMPALPAALPSLPTALPSLPSLPSLPVLPASSTSAGWQANAPSMPQATTAAAPAPSGATTVTATVGPSQPAVTAPTDQKISTGAMVAGGLGLAALVGVVAVAAGGKRTTTRTSTTRGPVRRAPAKSKSTKKRK